MRRRSKPVLRLLLPLALVLAVRAGPLRAEEDDLSGLRPETLVGESADAFEREATGAYREGRYLDAARAYAKLLERRPGDSAALYNLACCFGLLGRSEQAAAFLTAASDAGFENLVHARGDPDFASVRESEAFREALSRLAERVAEKRAGEGEVLTVPTQFVATARVVAPDGLDAFRRYPLVVGLHGFGSNAESFAGLFRARDVETPFLYCAIRAPYAFPVGREIGWSWSYMEPDVPRSAEFESFRRSERFVLDTIDRMTEEYPVDEQNVFLLGFSQGAGLAFSIGLRHSERFRGVIPIGGWLEPGVVSRARLARAKEFASFLICHSPGDRVVPWSAGMGARKFLAAHGIRQSFLSYEGGHSIPAEVCRRVAEWVGNPESGEWGGPGPVRLGYRFPEGREVRYRSHSETEVLARNARAVARVEQDDTTVWTGRKTAESGSEIEVRYESIRLLASAPPYGPVDFDSARPPEDPGSVPAVARAAAALVGRAIRFTVSPRGEVSGLSGYADILDGAVAGDPELAAYSRNFDDEVRGRAMQVALGFLPDHPVSPGAVWSERHPFSVPGFEDLEIEVSYEFAEIRREADGRRIAVIRSRAKTGRLERTAAAGEPDAELTGLSLEGETQFDVAGGYPVASRRSLTLRMVLRGEPVSTVTRTRTEEVRDSR